MKKKTDEIKQRVADKLGRRRAAKLRKALNIAKIVKNIVCWTLVAVLVFIVITFLLARVNGGTPSVFGYTLHRIETGSMEPELHVEDVILCKDISDVKEVQAGDIITFQGGARFDNRKVTHRVQTAPYLDDAGEWVLVTKGDANEIDDGEIKFDKVESKMLQKVEALRILYSFFFSPWGLIIFIALLILVFFDELLNIIRISTGKYDEAEEQESIGEIIERIKREDAEKEKRAQERNRRREERQRELRATIKADDLEIPQRDRSED